MKQLTFFRDFRVGPIAIAKVVCIEEFNDLLKFFIKFLKDPFFIRLGSNLEEDGEHEEGEHDESERGRGQLEQLTAERHALHLSHEPVDRAQVAQVASRRQTAPQHIF